MTATIAGNHIGVTRAGTGALGNTVAGVSHRSTAAVAVGGTSAGRRNVISGNDGSGIETTSAGTGQLTVQANYIGVAADGTTAAANGGAGIHVATKASIGGAGAAANRIAQNTGDGVFVAPEATGATTVLENEIFANGQLAIDLGVAGEPPPGVTANDAGDVDSGGNGLQNFPRADGRHEHRRRRRAGARRARQRRRLVHAARLRQRRVRRERQRRGGAVRRVGLRDARARASRSRCRSAGVAPRCRSCSRRR